MLSSIIPWQLYQDQNTCHQAWPSPRSAQPKQQQGRQSSYYEQHGHGARTQAERARQPMMVTNLPARQWPRSPARLMLLHLHSDGATKPRMIVTLNLAMRLAYLFSHFVQNRLEARLDNACEASAVEHCDPLPLPGTIPFFQPVLDISRTFFGPQPTFTSTCGDSPGRTS